jgi:hypothetical protein
LRIAEVNFERENDLHFVRVHVRIAFHNRSHYANLERQLQTDGGYQLIATREL